MTTDGEYIVHRLLPGFIRDICRERGIEYQNFSDDWVLRLEREQLRKWIIGYTFDLNSATASSLALDKVASYQALAADNLPVIEHYLARSRASVNVQMKNLTELSENRPVVIKPLQGASGHGIHLFPTLAQAIAYLADQAHTDWTIAPWYDIGMETRLIICDDKLLCAYEKRNPTLHDELLFYNLGMGAHAVNVEPSQDMIQLAHNAMKSVGLRLGAIDIATLADGSNTIVEVNEGIMMEHYARQSDEYKNRASKVYGAIIASMFD
jgi:glutathione synthase/RimK-type ligase-like ATP-grasp enzyme